MSTLVRVLESYRGKDRIIRLCTYVCMCLGSDGNSPLRAKFRKLATEFGGCRVILRLFDDFSLLMSNISNGFGLTVPNPMLRPLEVATSLLYQLYYPVEHIAWLRDKAILPGNSALFWLLVTINWVMSLAVEIIKSLIKLRINITQTDEFKKQRYLENSENRDCETQQGQQILENLRKMAAERRDLILFIVQSAADLINAISWLPKGILWSQKLKPFHNGLLGMTSTLIMIYRNWPAPSNAM